MRFYLDDLRDAPPGWELARTFDEGLRLLRAHRGQWEAMSLDHDLGDARGRTGFDFVDGMAELDLWAPDIYVHSTNAAGRERMLEFIAAEDERRGLAPDRAHPVARPDDHAGCATTINCWYCPERATESIESEVDAA